MLPHSLALLLSWSAVTLGCDGNPELAVTYIVPIAIGLMVLSPRCPLDTDGNQQPCAEWLDISFETAATTATLADPSVGQVLMWRDPVAKDAAGNRSDDPGGCSP